MYIKYYLYIVNQIKTKGVDELFNCIENRIFPKMNELYLDNNNIGNNGLIGLFPAINNNSINELQLLSIRDTNANENDIKKIKYLLKIRQKKLRILI